jgi:dual specificity MAP kinase phosphatase
MSQMELMMNHRCNQLNNIDINNISLDSFISDVTYGSMLENCFVKEPFTATLTFNSTISPEDITAQLYVNRPDGSQKNVVMTLASNNNNESYTYVATIAPDKVGPIEYHSVISAYGKSLLTNTCRLTVLSPKDEEWQHKPVYAQIAEGIWVGNARAAFEAEKHGFDRILNVADQFNFSMASEKYKYIPLVDWGTNAIPKEKIFDAVNWLTEQVSSGKKTIINCRAGIGRSGSIAIAYLYANNLNHNYHQVVHMARHGYDKFPGKSNIYPHVGLKETLEELYPGNHRPATTEIRNVWLDNYRIYQSVSKKKNEPIIVRTRVDYQGEVEPFVLAHSNITNHRAEDLLMIRKEENLYEAVLTPRFAGKFWLTVKASNYMTTTPWYESEIWLGNVGDNLYLDIQD